MEDLGKKKVAVGSIYLSDMAVRQAQTKNPQFDDLSRDIETKGIQYDPIVRPTEREGFEVELVDGCQRTYAFMAAKRRIFASQGVPEDEIEAKVLASQIQVDVKELNDEEMWDVQFVANAQRLSMTPSQMRNHLNRMVARNPNLTQAEIAKRIGKDQSWVSQTLNISKKLSPTLQALLDDPKSGLNTLTAALLTGLPFEVQEQLVSEGIINDTPKDRNEKIEAAKKNVAKGKKHSEWVPPAPKFITSRWEQLVAAGEAQNRVEYVEGLKAAVGQTKEQFDIAKAEWEAKKLQKTAGTLEEQKAAVAAQMASIEAQLKALSK